ncbi:MAG: hypothetical protein ACQEXJ_19870 [Myxococcota bacterium]
MTRRWTTIPTLVTMALALAACDDGDEDGRPDSSGGPDVSADAPGDAVGDGSDVQPDPGPMDVPDAGDPDVAGDATDAAEAENDAPPPEEPVPVLGPVVDGPPGSVLPEDLTSCAVYRTERCVEGERQDCAIWDSQAEAWADSPPPTLEQMYLYDRYYDLYHSMAGQHVMREFTTPMAPGTPEEEWSDPAVFRGWDGYGDGSGWTGTALFGASARYLETGTDADYERMLRQAETMAFLYEATGIPGMMMRSFFAMLDEGSPHPVGHPDKALARFIPTDQWHYRYPIAADYVERLPDYFGADVEIQGQTYGTTPTWLGDASRDMYVRSMPGVLLAYDLLGEGEREDAVRSALEAEIPCTLRRLKKIRIRNLQDSPDIQEAVTKYFASGAFKTDPDDLDLSQVDTLVGYVMEQPNPAHMDLFDASCPETLPWEVEPEFDFDAADDQFLLDFLAVMSRIGNDPDTKQPLGWVQVPSVRGSDALFMTQWALVAHYLTGEERYLDFVDQLRDEVAYWGVIDLMGSAWLPKWCRSFIGPSLLYPTIWNLQARIDPEAYPEFWSRLAVATREEYREKELYQHRDVYFGVLYDGMVDAEADPTGHQYAVDLAGMLLNTGQYQADSRLEPRRNYTVDLLDDVPEGVELEYLTDEDRAVCETPIEVFGQELEAPGLDDENPRAKLGLEIPYRFASDYQWTRDPFLLSRDYGAGSGSKQYPMQDMTVPFWLARMHGLLDVGEGTALAWRPTGEACEPAR